MRRGLIECAFALIAMSSSNVIRLLTHAVFAMRANVHVLRAHVSLAHTHTHTHIHTHTYTYTHTYT